MDGRSVGPLSPNNVRRREYGHIRLPAERPHPIKSALGYSGVDDITPASKVRLPLRPTVGMVVQVIKNKNKKLRIPMAFERRLVSNS